MDHSARSKITIRRGAKDSVTVEFPEEIIKDADLVADANGEIPIEFLTAALARAQVSRTQLAAGCSNKCGKDCFW